MNKAILLMLPLALTSSCSDKAADTYAAGKAPANASANTHTSTTSNGTSTSMPSGVNTTPGAQTNTNKPMVTPVVPGSAMSKSSDTPGSMGTTPHSDSAKADNTKMNERDRSGDTKTPIDQKENAADLELTQKIRQALVADDTLSFNAENVKIIAQNGTVTLRGPVKDQSEKDKIESKAKAVAGVTHVDNQLEVKGP